MPDKNRPAREPFRFSRGGVTAIAGFVAPPAIADDRIRMNMNRSREESTGGAIAPRSEPAADSQPRGRRRAA